MEKLSKGLKKFNLADFTKEQAKAESPIFYQAWADFQIMETNKRRKLLQRKLDKRRKI